jgi:serine-type D-Ala-D-Ala carboxypeptidase (penicillin-binding protein 5/6)
MKTLALLVILAFQTTGLWSHLSAGARDGLNTIATTDHLGGPPAIAVHPMPVGPLPIRLSPEAYDASATGALALDAATCTVLYSKNPGQQLPIASVTKMITALVILSRHTPDELAKLPALPAYQTADERIGLAEGETYRIGDLVEAALINSANDAADALALYDSGSLPKFSAVMNAKMGEWGITGTHFTNPTGLVDQDNYATPEALAKIAGLALTSPFIRATILKTESSITSTTGRVIPLVTTNKLLATGQFYGIKTGYTPAAGECFVGLTRFQGHEVITVILGSGDRFGATQSLTNWISRTYQWL